MVRGSPWMAAPLGAGAGPWAFLPAHLVSLFSTVNFDHFQILRAIGKGSFGKVRQSRQGGHGRTIPAAHRLWEARAPASVSGGCGQAGNGGRQSGVSASLRSTGAFRPALCGSLTRLGADGADDIAVGLCGTKTPTPPHLRLRRPLRGGATVLRGGSPLRATKEVP